MRIRDILQCDCEKIVFPVGSAVVEMYLPALNCTDMEGAITVAKMCNPEVAEIRTFADNKPDTFYFRDRDNKWHVTLMR